MNDIMLDLETLGLVPGSTIVSIGAVKFDRIAKQLGDEFYRVINLRESVPMGVDMDTLCWWMTQSDEARAVFNAPGTVGLGVALHEFAEFIHDPFDAPLVWGNGAAFDNVLLQAAYLKTGIPIPWKFYNDRCYRTVKSTAPSQEFVRVGVHHNALDDAKSQALHLMKLLGDATSDPAR